MREETLTSLNRARAVLENAKGESLRRRAEHHNKKKKKIQEDAEKKLNQAHHWVHQLWNEEKGGKSRRSWVYAVYWHPDVIYWRQNLITLWKTSGLECSLRLACQWHWSFTGHCNFWTGHTFQVYITSHNHHWMPPATSLSTFARCLRKQIMG